MMRNDIRLIPVAVPAASDGRAAYIEAFEEAIRSAPSRVRAVLFCNPQNPRAQIYSNDTINDLLSFCHRQQLHFISDEVYGLTTFGQVIQDDPKDCGHAPPTATFTSVAAFDPAHSQLDPSRIHLLHSISKDLGSSGLRLVRQIHCCVISMYTSDMVMQGFIVTQANAALRFSLAVLNHNKVSSVACRIGEQILPDTALLAAILEKSTSRLRSAAAVVSDFLRSRNVEFFCPVAGVYIWARLGRESESRKSDTTLTQRLGRAGVSVGTSDDYTERQPGWYRLTFSLPREELVEGLRRIARVLNASQNVDQYLSEPWI